MFLNILDINTARVECGVKKKAVDKSDGRGRAISINKTAEEDVEFCKSTYLKNSPATKVTTVEILVRKNTFVESLALPICIVSTRMIVWQIR